jgi:hypothetical protein
MKSRGRFSFRLRSLLTLVLCAGVLLAWVVKPMLWDPQRWRQLAKYHDQQARRFSLEAESVRLADPLASEQLLEKSWWHESRAAKYYRAAAYFGMPDPDFDSPNGAVW